MTITRRSAVKSLAAAAAGVSFGGLSAVRAYADYATVINPSTNYGRWQGWGAALSWWANVFGTDDTLADLFYTTKTVSYRGLDCPGLGLNVVRYNVGACTAQSVGTPPVSMVASPNIPRYKQIEGYWLNWNSTDPSSSSWNWSADANQRTMLGKARDRGANLFEMFSDSPIWWMCANHNPSGAADGSNNLQSWNYRQHAVYLATVAKYAQDNWGIHVASVEPFNEPSAGWWKADVTQEGCHLDPAIQREVIGYLRAELNSLGLTSTLVAASDENSYDAARTTWTGFSDATKSQVERLNVHGYQYGNAGGPRSSLYAAAHGNNKALWQSEYGEGWDHGLYLAYNLSLDLRYLHPTAWCYWQPVDGLTWGLIAADYPDPATVSGTLGNVANKYFVLAQYTRHIRPGMLILDSGDQATVAGYDKAAQRLVLVTVNGGTAQQISYDLSRFATVGGPVRGWITDANPNGVVGRQYAVTTAGTTNGKKLTVQFPPYTIQTVEIDGVTF